MQQALPTLIPFQLFVFWFFVVFFGGGGIFWWLFLEGGESQ